MNERDKRLQQIRERHAASTSGEWYPTSYWAVHSTHKDDEDEHTEVCSGARLPQVNTDMNFIAHAHQDVPFLLAEIERLESVLRQIRDGDTPAADYDMDERAYWVERIAGEALEPDA